MIRIDYQITAAHGTKINHTMFVDTLEKAEEICQKIDEVGYTLLMVNNEPDFGVD